MHKVKHYKMLQILVYSLFTLSIVCPIIDAQRNSIITCNFTCKWGLQSVVNVNNSKFDLGWTSEEIHTEWFGQECQFQCRCEFCNNDGSCSGGCRHGWFGFKCQYVNLVNTATIKTIPFKSYTSYLDDGNDSTCSNYTDLHSVEVILDQVYPFTWMRLKVKNENVLTKILVSFKKDNAVVTCQSLKMIIEDSRTIDVRCLDYLTINSILIQGDIVNNLCSIYISGGRNVALKGQTSSSSSLASKDNHMKAVDGIANRIVNRESCTRIEHEDNTPTWTLTLNEPFLINRFVLYNLLDRTNERRLSEFLLETTDFKGAINFNYTGPNVAKETFTYLPLNKLEVNILKIKGTEVVEGKIVLSLCEVQVYGDCQPSRWGLSCDSNCDTNCPDSCRIQDGKCDSNCLGHSDPPYCTKKCSPGKWGINCSKKCSSRFTCFQSSCDVFSGFCDQGCLGYDNPPYCTMPCKSGLYGKNCSLACSLHCVDSRCSATTGECFDCIEGYTGTTCSVEIQYLYFYIGIGFGITLSAVAVIAVIVCCIRRRRSVTIKQTETKPYIYNRPNESINEMHHYEQYKQSDFPEDEQYETIQ